MWTSINKFEIFARSAISKTSFWIALAPLIIKQYILHLLLPVHCMGCKQENTLLCASCLNSIPLYHNPSTRKISHLNNILVAMSYHHQLIHKAIKAAKYRPYASALLQPLSSLVIQFLYQFPKTCTYLSNNHFVLIPIPLSKIKYAHRGFNQAQYIALALSQEFKWPLNTNLLIKKTRTRSQTELSYSSRKTNIKNAFSVLDTRCPKNVILVDDVITTGATLEQAAKTLKSAGAEKIWAIVLAKS